jgi:HK97 family phage major capsid protein
MSLRKQLAAAQGRQVELGDEMEAIGAVAETEGRDLTQLDRDNLAALSSEFESLTGTISTLKAAVETADKLAASREAAIIPTQPKAAERLPAKCKRMKSKYFENTADCYAAGQWILATFANNRNAIQYCRDHGIGNNFSAAMEGGTDSAGGYTVPDLMSATIIELVESWGVYRQHSRNIMMASDTQLVPKLAQSMTVVFPGEGQAITPSDLTFDQVQLILVKMASLGIFSTELNEDSVISMTDLLTRDIARMFAYQEDLNGFLGDGTGTYGGQTGIKNALLAGAQVVQTGTAATAWAELTLADYQSAAGKLKEFGGISPVWFMSRYGYYNSVLNLLNTAGGTDMRQMEEGGRMMFLGYPVVFTQVLPGETTAADDLLVVLGDLDLGSYLGTGRNVALRTLTELYAASDQLAVMGTLRSIVNVHDVGTATDAGSIVGIYANPT